MPLGFKRWTDQDGVVHGRLEIGYMRQGLGLAYYEPVGEFNKDRGPEIGIFMESRGYKTVSKEPTKGSLESWSASTHDVYWYPWAKPFPGESSTPRGIDIIQRRDLYDMWSYLMETDPAGVAERAQGLNVPGKMRRWAFYQLASKWKRKDMKMRADKARRMGASVQDVELSDSEDDEGFGADEEEQQERMRERKRKRSDMPPPLRPGGQAGKRRKGNAAGAGAGGPANRGRGGNRARATDADLFLTPVFGSGAQAPGRNANHSNASRSPSLIDGRDANPDDDIFDTSAPRPSSRAISRVDTPTAQNTYIHPSVESVSDHSGGAGGNDAAGGNTGSWENFNNGLDDEAAEQAAMRASLVPEGDDAVGRGEGLSDSQMDRLMRGSFPLDPDAQSSGQVAGCRDAGAGPSQTDEGGADLDEEIGGSGGGDGAQTSGQGGQGGGSDAPVEKARGGDEVAEDGEGADGGKAGGRASDGGDGEDHPPKDEDEDMF